MKVTFAVLFILFLGSCNMKLAPLQGQYLNEPYQITVNTNKEHVWEKVIDLFATKGLPIKIIDKSSGLIISDKAHLLASWEDKNGKIREPKAYIVLPTYGKGTNVTQPGIVVGEWNIRIKEIAGKTIVNVNIVNLKYRVETLKSVDEYEAKDAKSTGVFEKMIADFIKE